MGDHGIAIDKLVGETRAARESLHALIVWLRHERQLWHEDADALARRARLTTAQRHRLRASVSSLAQRRTR